MVFKHNMKYQPWPGTLHLFLKRVPGFRSIKYHFCFRFFVTWTEQQHYKTSPYEIAWCLVALLAQNNFGEEYWTQTIFTVSICAWFRETVMRRGPCTTCDQSPSALLGRSRGKLPACCNWLNTGMADGRYPFVFVLTQSYPCDPWFVCSTLRELAVSI